MATWSMGVGLNETPGSSQDFKLDKPQNSPKWLATCRFWGPVRGAGALAPIDALVSRLTAIAQEALAGLPERKILEDARRELEQAEHKVTAARERINELAARRDDPKTLQAKDAGKILVSIDEQTAALRAEEGKLASAIVAPARDRAASAETALRRAAAACADGELARVEELLGVVSNRGHMQYRVEHEVKV
jgi:hypothetical protein